MSVGTQEANKQSKFEGQNYNNVHLKHSLKQTDVLEYCVFIIVFTSECHEKELLNITNKKLLLRFLFNYNSLPKMIF